MAGKEILVIKSFYDFYVDSAVARVKSTFPCTVIKKSQIPSSPTSSRCTIIAPGITTQKPEKHGPRLASFVRNGGQVIFAGGEENIVIDMLSFFDKKWTVSSYYRTTCSPTDAGRTCFPDGPASYSAKCVFLSNVPQNESMYGVTDESTHESLSMQMLAPHERPSPGLTSVAMGKYGAGRVAYFSDVNGEKETLDLILSMCVNYELPAQSKQEQPTMDSVNRNARPKAPRAQERRSEPANNRPTCRYWLRGSCTWGSRCRFAHPALTSANMNTTARADRNRYYSSYGDDDFEGEMEERMNNCGFTNDELDELLCQGVKPWEDDAWDVLDALHNM